MLYGKEDGLSYSIYNKRNSSSFGFFSSPNVVSSKQVKEIETIQQASPICLDLSSSSLDLASNRQIREMGTAEVS